MICKFMIGFFFFFAVFDVSSAYMNVSKTNDYIIMNLSSLPQIFVLNVSIIQH